jgi:hypothetical protein
MDKHSSLFCDKVTNKKSLITLATLPNIINLSWMFFIQFDNKLACLTNIFNQVSKTAITYSRGT